MYKEVLYEEGTVKESKEGTAVIIIPDPENCKECSIKIFCKPGNSMERILTVHDQYGLKSGDTVRISIKGNKILSLSFLLYGIPLLVLLISIFIGMETFEKNKELLSSFLAAGVTALYFILLFILLKRGKKSKHFNVMLTVEKKLKD